MSGPGLRRTLAADPSELAGLRRALREWAAAQGLAADRVERLLLACGEAVANAIEHGGAPPPAVIEVDVWLVDGGLLTVRVTDGGSWVEPSPSGSDGRATQRGRGLALIRALMDDVRILPGPAGTTVLMTEAAPGAATAHDGAVPLSRPAPQA